MDTTKKFQFTPRDFLWIFTLVGSAIGLGFQFLPLTGGQYGVAPLVLMALLVVPVIFFAHRNLARFILHTKDRGSLINVLQENFSQNNAFIIVSLYGLSTLSIVFIYGVSLVDAVQTFANVYFNLNWPYFIYAILVVTSLFLPTLGNTRIVFVLRTVCFLTIPLLLAMVIYSIMLIPLWSFEFGTAESRLLTSDDFNEILYAMWLIFPLLVLTMNYISAVSLFINDVAVYYKHKLDNEGLDKKINHIQLTAAITITFFTLFFVVSNILALSPVELSESGWHERSVILYNAELYPMWKSLFFLGEFIIFTALYTSFFAPLLATCESLSYLMSKMFVTSGKSINSIPNTGHPSVVIVYFLTLLVTLLHPSVLTIIENFTNPLLIILLFILPIYGIYALPSLKPYRKYKKTNLFVALVGLLILVNLFYNFLIG